MVSNTPLAWPVKLRDNTIYVLDETLLPIEEKYIVVNSLDTALKVLVQMKTRAFGQVLLFFYTCAILGDIDNVTQSFRSARPTFDFLLLSNILKKVCSKIKNIKEAVNFLLEDFEEKRIKRTKKIAQILPDFSKILTICNVSGELVYLYNSLREIGKDVFFYVSETRPYLQGSRLTMWEFKKANIPAKLIYDNQAAIIMENKLINCIITGSDRSTKNGDLINKIGTYPLAVLAKHYEIPFYALVQYPSEIDIDNINIEERPEKEAFMWVNDNNLPNNLDSFYPAFDITPSRFITKRFDLAGDHN